MIISLRLLACVVSLAVANAALAADTVNVRTLGATVANQVYVQKSA